MVVPEALVQSDHRLQLLRRELLRVPLPVARHLVRVPPVLLHQFHDVRLLRLGHGVPPGVRVPVDGHYVRGLRRVHQFQRDLLGLRHARRRRAGHAHGPVGVVAQTHPRHVRTAALPQVPVPGDLGVRVLYFFEDSLRLSLLRASFLRGLPTLLDVNHGVLVAALLLLCVLFLLSAALRLLCACCAAAAGSARSSNGV